MPFKHGNQLQSSVPKSIFHFPFPSLQFAVCSSLVRVAHLPPLFTAPIQTPGPSAILIYFCISCRSFGTSDTFVPLHVLCVSMYLHLAGCQTLEGLHLLPASLSLCVFTFLPPAGWLLCGQLDVILIGSPASGSHGGFSFDLCCGECAINLSE